MAIIYSYAKLIITGFTLGQEVSKLLLTNYYCESLETRSNHNLETVTTLNVTPSFHW